MPYNEYVSSFEQSTYVWFPIVIRINISYYCIIVYPIYCWMITMYYSRIIWCHFDIFCKFIFIVIIHKNKSWNRLTWNFELVISLTPFLRQMLWWLSENIFATKDGKEKKRGDISNKHWREKQTTTVNLGKLLNEFCN